MLVVVVGATVVVLVVVLVVVVVVVVGAAVVVVVVVLVVVGSATTIVTLALLLLKFTTQDPAILAPIVYHIEYVPEIVVVKIIVPLLPVAQEYPGPEILPDKTSELMFRVPLLA